MPNCHYHTNDEMKAYQYIDSHYSYDDVLLSGFFSGNKIPGQASIRSMYGHWDQTPFVDEVKVAVETFYDGKTQDADRLITLKDYGVDLVIFSPEEKELGDFNPDNASYLINMYTNQTIQIYAFRDDIQY